METFDRHCLDALEYYVTRTEQGWALIMRKGHQLSLTQHFASMRAAVTSGVDYRMQLDSSMSATS